MEATLATCEAHEIVMQEVNRVKESQAELYSLDRKRSEAMLKMQKDIAILKTDGKYTKEAIESLQGDLSEVKKDVSDIKSDIKQFSGIERTVNEMSQKMQSKKWQPKDYCLLVTSILTFVSAIVVALIGGR